MARKSALSSPLHLGLPSSAKGQQDIQWHWQRSPHHNKPPGPGSIFHSVAIKLPFPMQSHWGGQGALARRPQHNKQLSLESLFVPATQSCLLTETHSADWPRAFVSQDALTETSGRNSGTG